MSDDKNRYPAKEAVERMFDFIQGSEVDIKSLTIDAIRDELKRERIDVSPLVNAVKGHLMEEKMRLARQRRISIDQAASGAKLRLTPAEIRERISHLFERRPALAVEYRNFNEASPEDIEGLFEDLMLLGYFDDTE